MRISHAACGLLAALIWNAPALGQISDQTLSQISGQISNEAPNEAPTEAARTIILASTTSLRNSGLLDHILPSFTRHTGIAVRVVAVGTGAALRLGRAGDVDVLLTHHRQSEEAFVAQGHGVMRVPLMVNDYILVGPRGDPAGVGNAPDPVTALRRIADAGALFVSRGDESGTHKRERALWAAAKVDPDPASGGWYREVGAGMGAALNIAAGLDAYLLSDRATWFSFGNRGDLVLLLEGDARLLNEYAAILVSPRRHPHVKAAAGQAFLDWLGSAAGRAAITGFTIKGQQLFTIPAQGPAQGPAQDPK